MPRAFSILDSVKWPVKRIFNPTPEMTQPGSGLRDAMPIVLMGTIGFPNPLAIEPRFLSFNFEIFVLGKAKATTVG
jgi:hypothetical protein